MGKSIIVHTSDHGWLDQAVRLHLIYGGVQIEDDADVGVGPHDLEQLVALIHQHHGHAATRLRTVLGVGVGLCLSAMGLWMIHEAVADPGDTKELWVLLAGGVFMAFFGGLGVFYALGQRWRISSSSGDRNMTLGSD
ncbi:hypothetical protein [Pseudomonas sp. F(2018)]|uniref:hypothetical protein n=1 Tax=Pseudomonas sp. F(2018) TaxID=2502240 RepID=UPI0010F9111D|nr:hypothetical protein [Pseudomonas sp. F(2018)]